MATNSGKSRDARLNLRLPAELKKTIEQVAAQLGLTVSEFAVWALVQRARQVIRHRDATRLSTRDRDRPVAPGALKVAAKRRKHRS